MKKGEVSVKAFPNATLSARVLNTGRSIVVG